MEDSNYSTSAAVEIRTMLEQIEGRSGRRYRSKKWWTEYDEKMNSLFPIGSEAQWRSYGGHLAKGKITSPIARGRVMVQNMISGREYPIQAEGLIIPTAKSNVEMKTFLGNLLKYGSRSERLPMDRPICEPSDSARRFNPERIMPLSPEEMIAHTVLKSVTKVLRTINTNADSFRNPKLHELVQSARNALHACLTELESYERYPEDA